MDCAGLARLAAVSIPTFFSDEALRDASVISLGEDAAHHMRVRRLEVGARIRLVDGGGGFGVGVLTHLGKRRVTVTVEQVQLSCAPSPIHVLVPVADKDRMLWLAEKSTELAIASWRPVGFRRSRDVASRGTGPQFHQRVRARMIAALEQSGGAWLPAIYPEAKVEAAIAARPPGLTVLLDPAGPPLLEVLDAARPSVVHIVVGPEGGLEADELAALCAADARLAAIGGSILRFETAGIAAIAVVNGWFQTHPSSVRGGSP